jgi:pimeloyl-ACP methyl ester carboxylesterase
MKTDNKIVLKDHRILGFAEYGDPKGFPIIYFHGGQESRYSSAFMDKIAKELKIRIISPERPGIGLSTYQENRRFSDWGTDVSELVDSLSLETFSLLGLSGGAPHLLSCLLSNGLKIHNSAIVSGTTPYDYKGTLKGMWFPVKAIHWLAAKRDDKQLCKFIRNDFIELSKHPEKRMKQFLNYLPKPDRKLLSQNPEFGWGFIKGSLESYSQGIEGVVQEWKLYVSDWGLDLHKIKKHVQLWYGAKDVMAPKYRGLYYERTLANSTLNLIENEGHFSLIRNRLEIILSDLLGPTLD